MNVDPKVYELAKHFYPQEDDMFITELCEAIQELIEDMNPSSPE